MLLIVQAVTDRRGALSVPAREFVIVDICRFIKGRSTRRGNAVARAARALPMRMVLRVLVSMCALLPSGLAALAADATTLVLKDHRFMPSELSVPAGERLRIEVENQDSTPAEFESADLRVEKIVVPGGKIAVMVGPLKPGIYKFFDDYHPDTAVGTMTAVMGKAQD
jgi:hypothetical protein